MTLRNLRKRLFKGPRQEADDAVNLLKGGIELISPSLIAGWVHHPHHTLFDVRLLAGPHLLAKAPIDQSRPDVEEALQTKGLFGFQLKIPADFPLLRFEAPLLVLAISADGSQRFPLFYNGSRSTTQERLRSALEPERRGLQGHFDGLTPDGSQLHGWCSMAGGREPVKVWLQAQDLQPRELICQQLRPGMAHEGHAEACGFSLAIADWPEAAGATIWATYDREGLLHLPQRSHVRLPPDRPLGSSMVVADHVHQASGPGDRVQAEPGQPVERIKAASDYISDIANAQSTNSMAEAKQSLEEALAHHPNDLELLVSASNLSRVCSDYDSALVHAKQLIHNHPSFFDGYCRAAQDLAFHLGRQEEGLEIISIALDKFPNDMWVLWTAFLLYSESKNDDLALEYGKRLAELHATFSPIYPLLTSLLLKNKQDVQAEKLVEAGFSSLPTDIVIIRLKLELLLRQRQGFAYRSWLYCLTRQYPENLPEFLDYIHRLEVLSHYHPSSRRSIHECDVCCIASDEAPYIAEFIHHYLFLGFANIFIGINNSSDNTERIVRKISSLYPHVHILDLNHVQASFMQAGCYRVLFDYARQQSSSQYCLFVDIDEFWVADPFPTSIRDFLSKRPAFDVCSFHWIFFFGEVPFSPPLTQPQEYVWDQHVKSMCSCDADLIDVRVHAPLIAYSDNLSLVRGHSLNTEITFTLSGVDVHQVACDYEASPIGLSGCAWIMHRIIRSEIEYVHRLFKKRADTSDQALFRDNRDGYRLHPSTAGAREYFNQVLPPAEVSKYHQSLDDFLETCGVLNDIAESRKSITEEEIYKKLNSLSDEDLMRESALMSSIFSGTRFYDWLDKISRQP